VTLINARSSSLSLRGNETQDKILYELGRLKSSIEQSIQASFHHSEGFSHTLEDPSDARVAYNLQKLARAAQNFHSSASSTASTRESSSTIYGANGISLWNVQSDAAMSIRGGPSLTPNKRQQIDQFVKQQRRMTLRRQRKPLQHVPSSAAAFVVRPCTPEPGPAVSSEESQETESNVSELADYHDEGDDEAEFQSFLLSGLEEVAKDSMLNQEFAKAQAMLEEAIQRRTGSTSEDAEFKQLQIQLATCYFFQHKWQLAEPLIDSIAKSKANFDPVVCNLLHALAIANAVEKRFGKAITVCKQALQGKRRLKRDFGDTSEKECNETLGLLATIHDLHGNRLDAEALRRKLSNGFSYYHPENELEFIVSHPKLCTEVFGKKISLDWRRPQIPATNISAVAELMSDLPKNSFLSPIKEDDTPKNSKTFKKPLQTFHTKLNLSERLNTDSAKEVVGSSPSSTSGTHETFGTWWNDAGGGSSSEPGMSAKRSFTRRVVRFFGTRREPAVKSEDNWNTSPFLDTEDIASSPLRPKFGRGFWSKGGESQIFKSKKPKTKLRKRASDDTSSNSFSFLRIVGRQRRLLAQKNSKIPSAYEGTGDRDLRPWRYGVDIWLRSNLENHHNSGTRHTYGYGSSNQYGTATEVGNGTMSARQGALSWLRNVPADTEASTVEEEEAAWVPASQILEEEEEQSRPSELAADIDTVRYVPGRSAEETTNPKTTYPTWLRRFVATINDDRCEDRDRDIQALPSSEDSEFQSEQAADYFGPMAVAGPFTSDLTSSVTSPGRGVPMIPQSPGDIQVPVEIDSRSLPRVQKLTVTIPKCGERSEVIPLVAHHPAKAPIPAITQNTGLRPQTSVTRTTTLKSTTPTKTEIMTNVLNNFKVDDRDEPAVKKRLECGPVVAIRKERQRQAWVPASYFKDWSSNQTTVAGSIDGISQDAQERKLGIMEETPLASSEIDDFSPTFRDTTAQSEKEEEEEARRDPPKPRYQLADESGGEAPKSPTKLERAQKRVSVPKSLAIDKTQLSEQGTSVPENLVDSGSTSPCLPLQQLGRKFSWETVFEEDSISTVPTKPDPELASCPVPQVNVLNRKFSWSSDDIPETPDLVRSSSSSSSSSSSTSSTSSAFTSVSSTSTGPMHKFDPVMKDLLIVGNNSTSSLAETQNQDDFLEQLSARILDRKSKRRSAKTLPLTSKVESEVKAKQGDEPSSVDTKGSAEPVKSIQVKLQACEKLQALPFIHPTDVFQRMMEEEEREREKSAAADPTEGILNRRHPLRAKRKNRKIKREAAVDEEKRMLYPDVVSSSGALSIGIAI
jgi:hypothetical protein